MYICIFFLENERPKKLYLCFKFTPSLLSTFAFCLTVKARLIRSARIHTKPQTASLDLEGI